MRIGVDLKPVFLRRPGISTFLLRILADLGQLEHQHEFVLFGPRSALREVPEGRGFRGVALEIHEHLGKLRVPFYDQFQLPMALRRERIDLLFCPYVDAPFFSSVPLIITVYDLVLMRFPEWYPAHLRFYLNSLLRAHLRRAQCILTLSEFSKQELMNYLKVPPEKIRVLPCAVPSTFMRQVTPEEISAIRRRLGIPPDYLLYTGGADARKNLSRLFQAVGRLNLGDSQRYTLVLTGEKARYLPYRGEWEKEGLGANLVFTGFASEEDLVALYHGASLVVYPSLWEGFGLPVLEAIACGVPVATSRTSSMPEVGRDAAVYFDPQDVDDMVKVIQEALMDAGLRGQLRTAACRRRSEFQLHRPAETLLKLFDEVAVELRA